MKNKVQPLASGLGCCGHLEGKPIDGRQFPSPLCLPSRYYVKNIHYFFKKKQHKVNSEALTSFHIPVHSHIYPLASKIVLVQKIQRKQFLSGYTHLVSVCAGMLGFLCFLGYQVSTLFYLQDSAGIHDAKTCANVLASAVA